MLLCSRIQLAESSGYSGSISKVTILIFYARLVFVCFETGSHSVVQAIFEHVILLAQPSGSQADIFIAVIRQNTKQSVFPLCS